MATGKIRVTIAELVRASILALRAYFNLDKDLQEQIATWENEGGSYE